MTAHLCVAGGLFATAAWQLERLHADKLHVELRAQLSLPASASHPITGVTTHAPTTHITHDHVQLTKHPPTPPTPQPASTDGQDTGPGGGSGDPNSPGTCVENCDGGERRPVCGDGSLDTGEQCDDGNTVNGDGCSSTCLIEVKPQPPTTATIAPSVLQGLRISGDTQVRPSDYTQTQMVHDGASRVLGVVKLCVATDGGVSSATVLRSTKYVEYDQRLLAAVQGWRYQPYSVNGAAVRACSTVTFIYQIQ